MGKIYQHIYSNLTLKEILHWHAAIALNNRKWKKNNHENENKNSRVQPLSTDTKQSLDEVEHDIMNINQNQGLYYLPKPKAEADNTDTRFW